MTKITSKPWIIKDELTGKILARAKNVLDAGKIQAKKMKELGHDCITCENETLMKERMKK